MFIGIATAALAQEEESTSRLTIGGYGEATMQRMFYSDNWKRYTNADSYKDAPSHGQFDLPHVVIELGYDFGRGWKLGMEIEFEHGGTESAMEIEEEETGEYESEIERGGEVALEQMWIQKTWSRALNLRMGEIIVPVGGTNSAHLPNEFFTVMRPEGENTIIPCTWHQIGVSLWGYLGKIRYEVQFLEGLNADMFGHTGWVHDGAGSAYEFDIANSYATAARLDFYHVPGLRLGLSGYYGRSASNSLKSDRYSDINGDVLIGAIDFLYDRYNIVARGNFDYGHLSDSYEITKQNKAMPSASPSPKTPVASDAIALGCEVGYNIFGNIDCLRARGEKLYPFMRFDYYDSMYKTNSNVTHYDYCKRLVYTGGVNYMPVKGIVIKGEYSYRQFSSAYNNEPTISLGVCYSGMFVK